MLRRATLALLLLTACGDDDTDDAVPDASAPDGFVVDMGSGDECPMGDPPSDDAVWTDSGWVTGAPAGDATRYLSIPFAAPPMGDLRFRAPEPAACWDGVLEATTIGPRCMQVEALGASAGSIVGEEDCLTLNVWVPNTEPPAGGFPVLFFIHGGAFIQGSANQPLVAALPSSLLYEGRDLATTGPAVVVTANYRLGPFGFLAHPDLTAEAAGGSVSNWGLQDQRAALQWVQRNIEGFGGDPEAVTIFGESAGAVSVCAQLASAGSRDLFESAIMQSGVCTAESMGTAEARGSARVSDSVCGDAEDAVACLRGLTATELLEELPGSTSVGSISTGASDGAFGPVQDGVFLDGQPSVVLASGDASGKRLVVGANAEEMALFFAGVTVDTEEDFEDAVTMGFTSFGSTVVEGVLATYDPADYPTPKDALVAVYGDFRFVCAARLIAQRAAEGGIESRLYHFRRRPVTPMGEQAASHGIELLYVFGTLNDFPGFTPDPSDAAVSVSMIDYWTRFAAGDLSSAPTTWPTYDDTSREVLVFDDPLEGATDLRGAECDFWIPLYESVGL